MNGPNHKRHAPVPLDSPNRTNTPGTRKNENHPPAKRARSDKFPAPLDHYESRTDQKDQNQDRSRAIASNEDGNENRRMGDRKGVVARIGDRERNGSTRVEEARGREIRQRNGNHGDISVPKHADKKDENGDTVEGDNCFDGLDDLVEDIDEHASGSDVENVNTGMPAASMNNSSLSNASTQARTRRTTPEELSNSQEPLVLNNDLANEAVQQNETITQSSSFEYTDEDDDDDEDDGDEDEDNDSYDDDPYDMPTPSEIPIVDYQSQEDSFIYSFDEQDEEEAFDHNLPNLGNCAICTGDMYQVTASKTILTF